MRRSVVKIAMAVLAVAMLCVVLPSGIVDNDGQVDIKMSNVLNQRASHAPIAITSNSELSSAANGGGSGTSGSPYIIENYEINGASGTHCISVSGTTNYFIIRGCTMWSATNGIKFNNVINGEINNCDISGCGAGVYISASSNLEIHNNTIYSNTGDGIKVNNVNSNINIVDNDCYDNGNDGIGLWWFSDNNWVLRNNCTNNNNNGITVGYFADSNIVEKNELYINHNNGIFVRDCDWNEFYNNECEHNYINGMYLTFAGNTTLKGNDLWDNNRSGVRLFNSNFSTLQNNVFKQCGLTVWGNSLINWNTHTIDTTNKVNGKSLRYLKNTNSGSLPADTGQVILANCTNIQVTSMNLRHATIGVQMGYSKYCTIDQCNTSAGESGIFLSHSDHNNVTNNVARDLRANGIHIHYSNNNWVDNNDAYHDQYGILIRYAQNNYISNNTAKYNDLGIFLWDSTLNDVHNNEAVLNNNCSIFLEDAINNTVRNNNATWNNYKGIWLWKSDANSILENYCKGNAENGIYLFDSESNYIANNYVIGHTDQGILIEYMSKANKLHYNHVYDNTLDGIFIRDNSPQCELYGNVVYTNGINGIHIDDASGAGDVSFNLVHHNPDAGIRIYDSDGFTVNDNHVHDNDMGIFFAYSKNNQINRNLAENNVDSGISLDFLSDGCTLTKNRLVSNNHGINIASSKGILVQYNNFIGNTGPKQSYDGSYMNDWNGTTVGNYWDDWTSPDTNGDHIVDNPYVLDGPGETDDFPLAVEAGMILIDSPDKLDAYEDTFYYNDYSILQINKPPTMIYWSVESNATWLSIDATGRLSGTPANSDTGTAWVNVIADDGTPQNRDSQNFTITVNNVEYPPLINVSNKAETNEDALYYVDYNASDNDPFFIHTWKLTTNAPFLKMNNDTGVLSGVPLNEHVGEFWVVVSVTDGTFNDTTSFNLTVLNTNDPPEIITEDVTWTREVVNYNVWYRAIDIDPTNDKIEWYLHTNASFLWILRTNGTMGGTPMEGDAGTYWINVTAKDGRGGQDFTNFTLTVDTKLGDENRPPEVYLNPGTVTIQEDSFDGSIILTDWFIDPDWNKLTFTKDPNVNISIEIKTNSNVYLTPAADWSGQETLTFYANDSEFEISDSVLVIVEAVNDPPEAVAINFEEAKYYANRSQPAWGNVTDKDIPFGDNFTWEWSTNTTGVIGNEQVINMSLPAGDYIIKLVVTDQGGKTAENSKNIVIHPDPDSVDPNDTDMDGLPDDWERDHFGTLVETPDGDPDEDGKTNLEEYEADTDPNVDESKVGDDDDGDKSFLEKNWWWLLIILVVVVLLIIIILVVVATRKKEPQRPPPRDYDREPPRDDAFDRPPQREEPQYQSYKAPDYSDAGTAPPPMPPVDFGASTSVPAQQEQDYLEPSADEPVDSPFEDLAPLEYDESFAEGTEDDGEFDEADDYSDEIEDEEDDKDIYGYEDFEDDADDGEDEMDSLDIDDL